jgi:hypothetical protein
MTCLLQDASSQSIRKTAYNKRIGIRGGEVLFGHNGTMSKDSIHTYTYGEDGFEEGLRWMYEILEEAEWRQGGQKVREMDVNGSVIEGDWTDAGWYIINGLGWHELMKIYLLCEVRAIYSWCMITYARQEVNNRPVILLNSNKK